MFIIHLGFSILFCYAALLSNVCGVIKWYYLHVICLWYRSNFSECDNHCIEFIGTYYAQNNHASLGYDGWKIWRMPTNEHVAPLYPAPNQHSPVGMNMPFYQYIFLLLVQLNHKILENGSISVVHMSCLWSIIKKITWNYIIPSFEALEF